IRKKFAASVHPVASVVRRRRRRQEHLSANVGAHAGNRRWVDCGLTRRSAPRNATHRGEDARDRGGGGSAGGRRGAERAGGRRADRRGGVRWQYRFEKICGTDCLTRGSSKLEVQNSN